MNSPQVEVSVILYLAPDKFLRVESQVKTLSPVPTSSFLLRVLRSTPSPAVLQGNAELLIQ